MAIYADLAFAIPIAILYPSFFIYLARVISKQNEVDAYCNSVPHVPLRFFGSCSTEAKTPEKEESTEDKAKRKEMEAECAKKQEDARILRFILLLAAGVVAVIMSGFVETMSTRLGLVFGGIFCILNACWDNWYHMNDFIRASLTGVALCALLYVSINMYKNGIFQKYLPPEMLRLSSSGETK